MNDKENIMNEGTLPGEMHRVPADVTIPVGYYYFLSPATGGALYLGHTDRPYWPSERSPETTYFSLQRLEAKQLPVEVGSFIFDVVTEDGGEYEFGMRLRGANFWEWVLVDPATGHSDRVAGELIKSFNLEPASASPDPLDESNKGPRVDSDGDVLIWVEDKEHWDYLCNAGDEDSLGYRSLEEIMYEYGVAIDGFASDEQVSRAQP